MSEQHRGIWVFAEVVDGTIAGVSLELLGAGRDLADKLDVPLAGVLLGENITPLSEQLIHYGADEVYVIDDPVLKDYRTEPFLAGMGKLARMYVPEIILYGATPNGKDIASAIATDLKTGLTADCTMLDVNVEKRLLEASRPAFGGNIMATILCKKHRPQMATVRPKVMKALPADPARKGTVIEEKLQMKEEEIRTKVLEIIKGPGKSVDLGGADVIVCGGKGMGDEQGFQLIHQLADTIGASVGGTRDAVEAGWLSHDHQVGQTGETVTPKIYFAIGVSGAIQHTVGMKNSEMIIAINKDPDAPIFDIATYGMVGDAREILPVMIKAFGERLRESEVVSHA